MSTPTEDTTSVTESPTVTQNVDTVEDKENLQGCDVVHFEKFDLKE